MIITDINAGFDVENIVTVLEKKLNTKVMKKKSSFFFFYWTRRGKSFILLPDFLSGCGEIGRRNRLKIC